MILINTDTYFFINDIKKPEIIIWSWILYFYIYDCKIIFFWL